MLGIIQMIIDDNSLCALSRKVMTFFFPSTEGKNRICDAVNDISDY